MSEQRTLSNPSEINVRTARAIAAILGQTKDDELLHALNKAEGRNQAEQASFLSRHSPFLREIYERGGTVVGDVVTIPKENLSHLPEIEIATTHTAVEKLTRLTGDVAKAKELAPQLVEMGTRIAGSNSDGETQLKVFNWLYRTLESKQELLEQKPNEISEPLQNTQTETQFDEKWQQIVELSESLYSLEPKYSLPEYSLEELRIIPSEDIEIGHHENLTEAEIYENAGQVENGTVADETIETANLIGFERIEINQDLPKIPEDLFRADFERLLEKMGDIDSQLEHGKSVREVLAPFRNYIETTKLDDELRQIEKEYARVQAKKIGSESLDLPATRFVPTREELRELDQDNQILIRLREIQSKLQEGIKNGFDESIDRGKVSNSRISQNAQKALINQVEEVKTSEIVFVGEETELRQLLVKEKEVGREIETLIESISEREKQFRPISEIYNEKITLDRQAELTEKVLLLELALPNFLKEKYPELSPEHRNEKQKIANTFEIQNPAEYLFVRREATKYFQLLRDREINKEYRQFDKKDFDSASDIKIWRKEKQERLEKINSLKSLEFDFAYKIEGSDRVIQGTPSSRAAAGYEFASQYVRYQLKQPETRLRQESAIYRDFAKRLESAKSSEEVWRESYKIRQENHRSVGEWKNSTGEERQKLERPLSKTDLTLLFLEQAPRHYTAEMSVIKYNFAHYSQAKERMTTALQEEKLEPSEEAKKLLESLETRLDRSNPQTRHKATKHFFESLQTENDKLFIKNVFDHHAVYQSLPPHEKDWLYERASAQKENLEYKLAYQRQISANNQSHPQEPLPIPNENSKKTQMEFADGTLWHQAVILAGQIKTKNIVKTANINENFLQAVGLLIHNQTKAKNLRVAYWLEQQKSVELKTTGEILRTFASATREIENNKMTVTMKFTETDKVPARDFKYLFASYFPEDFEKLKEFRISEQEKFKLENSRREGQKALLDEWTNEFQSSIYRPNAPISVFANEQFAAQEVEKIKKAQVECRRAVALQASISRKYEEKLKHELAKTGQTNTPEIVQSAVNQALSPTETVKMSGEQKELFVKAQDKILISDFERFRKSSERLQKGLFEINQSFEKIAALRLENSGFEHFTQPLENNYPLQNQYEQFQKQSEIELLTLTVREKFQSNMKPEKNSSTIYQILSPSERENVRTESHRRARIALEPKELNGLDRNFGFGTLALEFADALENAHQKKLLGGSESEIQSLFSIAEEKSRGLQDSLITKKDLGSSLKKPLTLTIYERELFRNERAIAQMRISSLIENGEISRTDLETKKVRDIFSPQERQQIRIEASEQTRENLEPKELWIKRQSLSENLQQVALRTSNLLEKAHEIYNSKDSNPHKISRVFSALDLGILTLKKERRADQQAQKFIDFKANFKRDLAQMVETGQGLENSPIMVSMTKGLLIDSLEKQNMHPEKIGLNGEKLTEISRTITLALGNEIREKNRHLNINEKFGPISDPSTSQTVFNDDKETTPIKINQTERIR